MCNKSEKKRVFITGVSRGIGRAIAEIFLKNGYELFGTFLSSEQKAEELVKEYGSENVTLFGPYDFSDLSQTQQLVDRLKEFSFDSLICSAGMFSVNDDFNNFDLEDFNNVMYCNFYTPLIISIGLKECIKDNGSIVLMSSNDIFSGAYSSISYSISKSALICLMKCLCVNFGSRNVRVNSVAPGDIDTDMNTPEQMNIAPYFAPVSRAGKPVDVAKVVYFLASDEASFISGENITIDGGYSVVSILLKSEADSDLSENLQGFIRSI